jgi:D-alanyl-D-alanine carboxypeptidase
VVTLSGYAFNRKDKAIAFSILINNTGDYGSARRIADDVCKVLVDSDME